MNLRQSTALGLGRQMGAVVGLHDARHGMLGAAVTSNRAEFVYYDSVTAQRTCLGKVS